MHDLNRYYREVRSWLPCSHKRKEYIMSQLQENVRDYLEEHPDADTAQIRAHFGDPEAIAAAYVDEMGTDVLLRDLRIRRKVVSITAGTMAAILALWMGVVGWAIVRELNSSNGSFIQEDIGYGEYVEPQE